MLTPPLFAYRTSETVIGPPRSAAIRRTWQLYGVASAATCLSSDEAAAPHRRRRLEAGWCRRVHPTPQLDHLLGWQLIESGEVRKCSTVLEHPPQSGPHFDPTPSKSTHRRRKHPPAWGADTWECSGRPEAPRRGTSGRRCQDRPTLVGDLEATERPETHMVAALWSAVSAGQCPQPRSAG